MFNVILVSGVVHNDSLFVYTSFSLLISYISMVCLLQLINHIDTFFLKL